MDKTAGADPAQVHQFRIEMFEENEIPKHRRKKGNEKKPFKLYARYSKQALEAYSHTFLFKHMKENKWWVYSSYRTLDHAKQAFESLTQKNSFWYEFTLDQTE